MSPPVVTVTRRLTQAVEHRLLELFNVNLNDSDCPMSRAKLIAAMQSSDAVLCSVADAMDVEVLACAGRRANLVANFGVGFDNIDLAAAKEQGIVVTNTPDVLTEATADIAWWLILSATRATVAAQARLRNHEWQGFTVDQHLGMSVQGKVLGVLGMGRIGQAVARRAVNGFGMRVIYFNRSEKQLDFPAERAAGLEDLLRRSDVLTIHVPGGGSKPLLTRQRLALLKPTSYLINTARGTVVDETALIEALQSGSLAGAGLDVYTDEPNVPAALLALPQVTLLPHIGSATREVRDAMGMLAVDNLVAHFAGQSYPSRVV